MGCFLVMTSKDFQMVQMMNRASYREHPAFEKVQYISRVNNPKISQQEILVKTEKELAQSIQKMFPDTRKSVQQDSHHIFPQKHRSFFQMNGVNVDEYAVLMDQKSHLQMHMAREGYNAAWNSFVDTCQAQELSSNQTKEYAIRYAGQLLTTFGLGDTDISQYRKHMY